MLKNVVFNHCTQLKARSLSIATDAPKGTTTRKLVMQVIMITAVIIMLGLAPLPRLLLQVMKSMNINDRAAMKGFDFAGTIKMPRFQHCKTDVCKFLYGNEGPTKMWPYNFVAHLESYAVNSVTLNIEEQTEPRAQ
jgi:hypothetical protein